MSVDYGEDGKVLARTAIGGPLAAKQTGRGSALHLLNGRVGGAGSAASLAGLPLGAGAGGRALPLLLLAMLLPCLMAALAAVAGAQGALTRVLGLPWLSS